MENSSGLGEPHVKRVKYEAVRCIQKTGHNGIWERFRSPSRTGAELAGQPAFGEKLTLRTRGNPCKAPREKRVFRSVFQSISSLLGGCQGEDKFPVSRKTRLGESGEQQNWHQFPKQTVLSHVCARQ